MKEYLAIILWCLAQQALLSQTATNRDCPTNVLVAAEQLFSKIRSTIGNELESSSKKHTIGVQDLDAIFAVLDTESNRLQTAAYGDKLSRFAAHIEAIRSQLTTVLKDPGNKTVALGLEPEDWLCRITQQKSAGIILAADIARLRDTVDELRRWAALLEQVVPLDQVGDRLTMRLAQLLDEWRRQQWSPAESSQKPDDIVDDDVVRNGAHPRSTKNLVVGRAISKDSVQPATRIRSADSTIQQYRTIRLGPGVATVLALAKAGTPENQITAFVDGYGSPFGLDADQIIHIHDKVSVGVICRMLQHDGALRSKAAQNARR